MSNVCTTEYAEALRKEIAELQRQNAAMREALQLCHPAKVLDLARQRYTAPATEQSEAFYHEAHARMCEMASSALAPNAGRDFIPREQVKPLADAIRAISEAVDKMSRTEDRQELADGFTAAETARRKG